MSEELGREPTDDELGEEIGIAAGKVSQLKTVSIRPASLDAPISDDDSTEFGEIVGDEEAMTPFELLRDKTCATRWAVCSKLLDDRERKDYFLALRARRRQAEDARRSWEEIWGNARAHSAVAKHCVVEIASRPGEKRAADRHRSRDAGRGVRATNKYQESARTRSARFSFVWKHRS